MKTKWILSILFIFSLKLLLAQDLSTKGISINRDGDDYLINFQLPSYQILTKKEKKGRGNYEKFSVIDLPEYGIVFDEGKPQLPQITFCLAISYNHEGTVRYEILDQSFANKEIGYRIYPAQYSFPSELKTTKRQFCIDEKAYSRNKATTSSFVEISEPFIVSGVKGIRVTIFPFSYNPVSKQMKVTEKASFRIKLNDKVRTEVVRSACMDEYLNRFFANYSDCINTFENRHKKSSSLVKTKGKYLMLVPWKYDDIAFRYLLHKQAQGYDVIYYRYLGHDGNTSLTSPSDMKKVIQSAYNNLSTRPEYVLLIGGIKDIGTWEYDVDDVLVPSDLWYAQLDGADVMADVSFGRWPVTNRAELEHLVRKSIQMDNQFLAQYNTPKNAVVISDYDKNFWRDLVYPNYEESSNIIADELEKGGYTYEKIYEHSGGTTADITNAINNNPYIVTYRGHGSDNSWGGPRFSNHSSLTNTVYPLIFSIACNTADFTTPNNLGMKMVNSEHGAVTFLGGTEVTPTESNAMFCKELFRDSYHSMNNVGKMIDYAKANFAKTIYVPPTSNKRKKRLIVAYNLLGDPSLQMRYDGADKYKITQGEIYSGEKVGYSVAETIEVAGVGAEYEPPSALNYVVNSNANAAIGATEKVILQAGFHAKNGSSFRASIVPHRSPIDVEPVVEKKSIFAPTVKEVPTAKKKSGLHAKTSCYPNPFSDQVSFEIALDNTSKVSISIFDTRGMLKKRLLLSTIYEAGNHVLTYSLPELEPGIYIYKVNIGSAMFYSKIVKR